MATSPVKKFSPLPKLLYVDPRRETQEGPPQDHVAWDRRTDGNQGDGEDLGRHQAYGKGPADVEGACCCPTCHLGVKGMSE